MKKFIPFILFTLAAIIFPQRSAAQATLAVDNVTVIPGATTTIEVKYAPDASTGMRWVEFKVELPEGLSFVDGSGKEGSAIESDFALKTLLPDDRSFVYFSITNDGTVKNLPEGTLLTFDVLCDENLTWEENKLTVFDTKADNDVVIEGFDVPVHRGTAFTLDNGMFLRIKADDSHYLCMPGADAEDDYLTIDGTGSEKGSIFYWDGSTLLSYMNGQYVTVDGEDLVSSSAADDKVEFTMTQSGNHFVISYTGIYKKKPAVEYVVFEDGELDASRDEEDATPLTFEALETLPVTTNASGYATLYSPVALTVPEGVKAYTATCNEDRSAVVLGEVSTVPAACGVVIEAEDFAAHTFDFPLSEKDATPAGDLTGSFATIETVEGAYTLQCVEDEIGFYRYNGDDLAGFKAYLTGVTAQSVHFAKEDDATGIAGSIVPMTEDAEVYDLQGRRVMTKVHDSGLYIKNGKKIVK